MNTDNLRTVSLAEIIDLPVHPVADLFPMLPDEARKDDGKLDTLTLPELADSILYNGLQEPIVLFRAPGSDEISLLDGRNRRAACLLVIEANEQDPEDFFIPVKDFIGTLEEADEYVLTLNVDRRDLTPSQRAFVAVSYWDLRSPGQGTRTDLQPSLAGKVNTAAELSQRFRVSRGYIEQARRFLKDLAQQQVLAEADRQEAERQAAIEQEAQTAIALAKADNDELRVRDEAHKANQAALDKAYTRESWLKRVENISKQQSKLGVIQSGKKSLNDLKSDTPGQETGVDDPVNKAKLRLNKVVTDLVSEFAVNVRILLDDGNAADRENVRQKLNTLNDFTASMNKSFGGTTPLHDLIDPEENRDHWSDIESRNRG